MQPLPKKDLKIEFPYAPVRPEGGFGRSPSADGIRPSVHFPSLQKIEMGNRPSERVSDGQGEVSDGNRTQAKNRIFFSLIFCSIPSQF